KEDLDTLGFASFNGPNTYFGKKTRQGVEDFQEYYGLPISGIADEPTLTTMEEILSSPFQYGERHKDSVQLKEDLDTLGFASFNGPNTYFGTKTRRGIEDFQKYYGLPVSGIADESTLEKIQDVLSSPFQYGKRDSGSVQLKRNLDILGYASFNNPNNYFGKKTREGVKAFQKNHGIPVSGIADEQTRKAINEAAQNADVVKVFLDPGHGGHD